MFVESVPVWQWHRGVENIDKMCDENQTFAYFDAISAQLSYHMTTCSYRSWPLFQLTMITFTTFHDDVIKWKHFPSYSPFVGLRWILRTKASGDELWCFFDLRLNRRLSKQSWGWWFKTQPRPLWRHSNGFSLSWWLWKHVRLRVSAVQNKASKIKAK